MNTATADLLHDDRLEWHQKIFRRILDRETPPRRHHADDRVEARGKPDLPADDVRIGRERAMPAFISQDNHARIDVVLGVREATPKKRRYAEHIENVRSNRDALERARFFIPDQDRFHPPKKPPGASESWIAL